MKLRLKIVLRRAFTMFAASVAVLAIASLTSDFSAAVDNNVDCVSIHFGIGNVVVSAVSNSNDQLTYGRNLAGDNFDRPNELVSLTGFGQTLIKGDVAGCPSGWVLPAAPVRQRLKLHAGHGWDFLLDGSFEHEHKWHGLVLNYGSDRTLRAVQTQLPFWPLGIIAGIYLIRRGHTVWKKRAKFAAGYCAGCGYDLRATPGRCPECGKTSVPIRC